MKVSLSKLFGGSLVLAFAGIGNASDANDAYLRRVVPTSIVTSPSDAQLSNASILAPTSTQSSSASNSCLSCDVTGLGVRRS